MKKEDINKKIKKHEGEIENISLQLDSIVTEGNGAIEGLNVNNIMGNTSLGIELNSVLKESIINLNNLECSGLLLNVNNSNILRNIFNINRVPINTLNLCYSKGIGNHFNFINGYGISSNHIITLNKNEVLNIYSFAQKTQIDNVVSKSNALSNVNVIEYDLTLLKGIEAMPIRLFRFNRLYKLSGCVGSVDTQDQNIFKKNDKILNLGSNKTTYDEQIFTLATSNSSIVFAKLMKNGDLVISNIIGSENVYHIYLDNISFLDNVDL